MNSMDGHHKRCTDYSLMGISMSGHADPCDAFKWHVYRDGRHIFSDKNYGACTMFAEELYERIQLARSQSSREQR